MARARSRKSPALFALIILTLAAACAPSPTSAPLTPVTVQLAWTHQAQFAGLYAADVQGYFAAEGLQVTFLESGSGADKLALVPYLKAALSVPYCHQEKWGGTGYPRGLKGERIPLHARILAVADVYDALTPERPYRPGWTEQRALEMIRAESGLFFDPVVVDAFL